MSHALYRLGRFAARRPWIVVGSWVAALVIVVVSSAAFGKELTDSFEVPGLDSQHALDLLAEAQSDLAGLTARVVMTPNAVDATFFDSVDAASALSFVQAEVGRLDALVGISDAAGALAGGPEAAIASGAISPDGRVALLSLQYPMIDDMSIDDLFALTDLQETLSDSTVLQVEAGGELFFAYEDAASGTSEVVGLIAAIIILLVAFGSFIAMGLPIGMALFGLIVGLSSMAIVTHLVEIPAFAPEMATMIGLGVGIDYALFLVTRQREFLDEGLSVPEAAGRATATSGLAVVFAGGTVVIAILGLAVAGIPFMTAAGVATSIIVGLMVIASITLLPAFFGIAGMRLRRGVFRRRGTPRPAESARWQRWGTHVARHAWAYAIGVTVSLIALTAPLLDLRLGWPDEGSQPLESTERRAYDLVADGFGPGVNGPLLIVADVTDDPSVVEPFYAAVSGAEGVVAALPPTVDPASGVATIVAIPNSAPQDQATGDTVDRLRTTVLPAVFEDSPARVHVGGPTASFADMGDKVTERLPWFIAAVVLLSFLLLTAVFRSIVVPIKAALLNLLSIGAAYGVLVMVFQWGWGAGVIGVEAPLPVVPFIPLFLFAVLFGLSMDYEVFLLSRVREEFRRTRDNDASVISGMATTARVISSAALIMISVFTAFAFNPDPLNKMVGLGLATAILVDATVVRLVLVPATMKLMGDRNWWLPAWLDRVLPAIDIEGTVPIEPERIERPPVAV